MTVTNDFMKPNNTISLDPVLVAQADPNGRESRVSGGTSGILDQERKNCGFDIESMVNVIDGGKKKTAKRRFIISPMKGHDYSFIYEMDRVEGLKRHAKNFFDIHQKWVGKYMPNREEILWMSEYAALSGSLSNHAGLFLPTILGLASDEQKSWWLIRALTNKIIGAYCQTELGTGSNVRGLQTTATYDKDTEEFIIDCPTLRSCKWWPGTLGKLANYAIVYAQLLIDGKEYGIHPFMVQIRDENHRPLPGIELGDLSKKQGDGLNDTGFCRFTNVRIPRVHMLARYQHVSKEGTFVKNPKAKNSKMAYQTMMLTRAGMIQMAGGALAKAVTIAIRYSTVRKQGFKNTAPGVSYMTDSVTIIDYSVQRFRLFRQLALAYAIKFSGRWMMEKIKELGTEAQSSSEIGVISNIEALPEIAATAAGLKAITTFLVSLGIEDARKCCGGNGYLLNSGIAALEQNYKWQTTAEGDFVILSLQTARFLMKSLQSVQSGNKMYGPLSYLNKVNDTNFTFESCRPSSFDVTSSKNLLEWFYYRALYLVTMNGKVYFDQLKTKPRDEAWNDCLKEMYDTACYHVYSFMLSNFIDVVSSVEDAKCQKALEDVCLYFALSNIAETNWFGLLSSECHEQVNEAIKTVGHRIRPNCIGLTDAFDYPDNVLNSTIGRYDGNVYEALWESAKKGSLNQVDPYPGWEESQKTIADMNFIKLGNKPHGKAKF